MAANAAGADPGRDKQTSKRSARESAVRQLNVVALALEMGTMLLRPDVEELERFFKDLCARAPATDRDAIQNAITATTLSTTAL